MTTEMPPSTPAPAGPALGGGPGRLVPARKRPIAGALIGLLSIAVIAGGFASSGAAALVLLPAFAVAVRESWRVYSGDRDTRRRVLVAFWSYVSAASLQAVITQHMWIGLVACPLIASYARYISRGGRVLLFPIPF